MVKEIDYEERKKKNLQSDGASSTTSRRGILSILKEEKTKRIRLKIINKKQTPKTIETIVVVEVIEVKLNKKV